MAFTAQATISGNSTTNASVDITLSPTTAIISATNLKPGDSATGTLNVSNTGSLDAYYFISADWSPNSYSNSLTAILANTLNVSVVVGGTALYTGTMNNLIDRPDSPGRQLTLTTGNENVDFTIALPSDAGNLVKALDINVDFVFVATD